MGLQKVRVFLLAGEPSGDAIGGRLIGAMKRVWPVPLHLSGVGGCCMEREGITSLFKDDIAVMGVTELIPHLITVTARLNQAVKAVADFKPHVIVTIDSKGFSFRLLKRVKEMYAESGQPPPLCVHYVAPSFWAWKGGEEKLRKLPEIVDHLLCILPFEEDVCKLNGLAATFVGHPVLEDSFDLNEETTKLGSGDAAQGNTWHVRGNREGFRRDHGLSGASPVLTVLPGSRLQELKTMLPIYGSAVNHFSRWFPDLAVIVPTVANDLLTCMVKTAVKSWRLPVTVIPGATLEEKYNSFAASDVGLATSGTAVMQLQLSRLPTVAAYRASWITERIIKHKTKLQYISLPNILLDKPVVPEALFSSCNPENLASLLRKLLEDSSARNDQCLAAESVLRMVQPPQPGNRPSWVAARVILNALAARKPFL